MSNNNLHNEDLLNGMAKNPFKTPENYFDDLSGKIKLTALENKLPKETGFKTPENYFDTFTVKKPKGIVRTLLPYISIAAIITMGVFIIVPKNAAIDNLNKTEIINYLSAIDELETFEIINNGTINNDNFIYAGIENTIDIETELLDLEINEYDIIDY